MGNKKKKWTPQLRSRRKNKKSSLSSYIVPCCASFSVLVQPVYEPRYLVSVVVGAGVGCFVVGIFEAECECSFRGSRESSTFSSRG